MKIKPFFEPDTQSLTYVVADPVSKECAVIDPVASFDPITARIDTAPAEAVARWIEAQGLSVRWLLETHIHADHVSATAYLQQRLGGETAIGSRITEVLKTFVPLFNLEGQVATDGRQFQHLLDDNATLPLGEQTIRVLHTPGHTPACVSYLIGDALFVGDTLFMPDVGTARCDFPGGDAAQLFASIQTFYNLPDETQVYVCHDYPGEDRDEHAYLSSIAAQKAHNIHVKSETTESEFIAMRRDRDKTLDLPRLMLASVQLNLCSGQLPANPETGRCYLHIPLNVF